MNYKKVEDIKAYVEKMLANDTEILKAEKFTRILARKGKEGEKIITWSVDALGAPLLEKEAVVRLDENGETGWVVTKIDDNGEILYDANGNKNEWIITQENFVKKYVEDPAGSGIYKPAGGMQEFIKLQEAILLQQWGSEMSVDKGGFLNVTNRDDIYAISARDFCDTYRIVE